MASPYAHDVFRGDVLDRCGNLRSDPDWLAKQFRDPRAVCALLWRYQVPLGAKGFQYFSMTEVQAAGLDPAVAYFLGIADSGPVFTLDISHLEKTQLGEIFQGVKFGDLRMSARHISGDDLAVLGFAKSLLHWQRSHNHCPKCGVPLEIHSGGHLLESADCDCKHFPRTDPAVIMVVTANDRALLGRQAAWPAGVYSALAGFVEPGESAEDAVRREVLEETGIRAGEVRYVASQPWPFPGSLMIGFVGEAEYASPVVDKRELDDARWFSREELASLTAEQKVILPPPISIARTLLNHWYCANGATPLQSAFD